MISPSFLTPPSGQKIAYRQRAGRTPTVVFLSGFNSAMKGTKSQTLDKWCAQHGQAYLCFDYRGHGESDGEFVDGCIGDWLEDTLSVIDDVVEGPLILVGSSMGAWIMLHAAIRRPQRIHGLLGIASAADFTELLFHQRLSTEEQQQLVRDGRVERPSAYDEEPYVYTNKLVADGRNHLLLDHSIPIDTNVSLIHSIDDPDVPWEVSLQMAEKIESDAVKLTLLKDAGHRLSRPQDLALILSELNTLINNVDCNE